MREDIGFYRYMQAGIGVVVVALSLWATYFYKDKDRRFRLQCGFWASFGLARAISGLAQANPRL
jgi:predicted Co/Zn/Cd cation transporter (cation efflux family)